MAKRKTTPTRTTSRFAVGLMSGTSCDGVDAAVIRATGRGERMRVALLEHQHLAFPKTLRNRLLAIMPPAKTDAAEFADLNVLLGELYAKAALNVLRSAGMKSATIIGCHGQTISHVGGRGIQLTRTLQLGESAIVAARTGCATVCDFRQADAAVGGQGAPLVPWADHVLFSHANIPRAIQNIGGIGNVAYLPAGGEADHGIAFDTGPGNMPIDELVRIITKGKSHYDKNGVRAGRGRVLTSVLNGWKRHAFFKMRPPKSAGREEFGTSFVNAALPKLRRASRQPNDWLATATALTAWSIADAYRRFLPTVHGRPDVDELILCGGGSHNLTLRKMLAIELPGTTIKTVDHLGFPTQAKEAVCFAMLALAHLDNLPTNLPKVTGANRRVTLGKLVKP
jgi:anhydro-N-acetylmuramic acid kinase